MEEDSQTYLKLCVGIFLNILGKPKKNFAQGNQQPK